MGRVIGYDQEGVTVMTEETGLPLAALRATLAALDGAYAQSLAAAQALTAALAAADLVAIADAVERQEAAVNAIAPLERQRAAQTQALFGGEATLSAILPTLPESEAEPLRALRLSLLSHITAVQAELRTATAIVQTARVVTARTLNDTLYKYAPYGPGTRPAVAVSTLTKGV